MKKLFLLPLLALVACSSEPEQLTPAQQEAFYEAKTDGQWDMEFTPDLDDYDNEERRVTIYGFHTVEDCRVAANKFARMYGIEDWSYYNKDANRNYICLYNLQPSGLYEYKMR